MFLIMLKIKLAYGTCLHYTLNAAYFYKRLSSSCTIIYSNIVQYAEASRFFCSVFYNLKNTLFSSKLIAGVGY